ncbi:MAG: glycosyltransferase [Candidatus Bathyarchaeota archaeon]|nr:glycosyltransferase [Candidatus Bathyarchaeota archaeon]
MHVVLLSHEYPPYQFGGVGTFVKDFANGLTKLGHEVTVICGRPIPSEPKKQVESNPKINVVQFGYPNLTMRYLLFQTCNHKKIVNKIKELKPDIIHGQSDSSFPTIASLKKIAPIVITFHGSPLMQKNLSIRSLGQGGTFGDFFVNGLGYPAFAYINKKEHAHADESVAVSKSLMNQLNTELGGNNFSYVHNGVNIELLNQLSTSTPSDNDNGKTLIFGGRLFWSKGVMNVVNLAYLLEKRYQSDLKVELYGSGPMYQTILDFKNRHGLKNLVLKGFTERSEFLANVKRSMFVLLPSFDEASPMLLLEGMCLGKIPVTFNLPYSREFTNEGAFGILADNIADMALKVKNYCSTEDIQTQQKRIQRFAQEHFDINRTAKSYCSIYKSLLTANSTA